MAAVADVQTVTITINDVEVQVPKGELIVESVKRLHLEIPIFCYHARMKPVGMCRMCIVEVGFKQPDGSVRKMPKPQAACTLPASDGMVVYTDTELVHQDRKGVLEFLLINHPLDCPVCDRGGECPLQNNTLFYGPSTSRFTELKRHLPKAFPLSKFVTLDLERCIQCGRCVRFTEEISGDAQLAFRFRGALMQPSTFELTEFESKFSGNVIEICPVGALTNSQYRFRARPWDLETRPAICTLCSNGCNIWFDYRVGQMVRINGRTNESVNEEWTCDRGKFGHDFYNGENRLTRPLIREGERLVPSTWPAVYGEILRAFRPGGNDVAALTGTTHMCNEDLFVLQRLFRRNFRSNNLDHRWTRHLPKASERLEAKLGVATVQNRIRDFERQEAVLVFGTSLADEQPILFLRVRKGWYQRGTRVVVAHDAPTDVDSFAHLILRYRPGTAATLAAGLALAAGVKGADARMTPEHVEQETGVRAADLREAAEILRDAQAPIVTTRSLYNLEEGPLVAETLASFALGTGGSFNLYGLDANDRGAELLGVLPDVGPDGEAIGEGAGMGTHEILEAAADGRLKALWLIDVDPFKAHPDRDLVVRALENVPFLVVQDVQKTEATPYASVVLPMCAAAEGDGSFTNLEGRVQRFRGVLHPKDEAKQGWRIFTEMGLRLQPETPLFNPAEIMGRIAEEVPEFAGCSYDQLGGEGFVLGEGADENRPQYAPPQVSG
jgi:NADH-quinone oxidoreductase subunit G